MRLKVLSSVAFATAGLIASLASAASAGHLSCPVQATSNVTLDGDVTCPMGVDGIDVLANGVTINLNGFTLSGAIAGQGIDNSGGFDDVTIRNGTIDGFSLNGIEIDGGHNNVISRVTILNGASSAIHAKDADGLVVSRASLIGHNQGVLLQETSGAVILLSVAIDNFFGGFTLNGSARTISNVVLVRNIAFDNPGPGFTLNGSHLTVLRNLSNSNGPGSSGVDVPGFAIGDVDDSRIWDNQANGNTKSGFGVSLLADGNTFRRNRATRNAQEGFLLAGTSNLLQDNQARDNGADGILDTGTLNTIARSRAIRNGGHGINANAAADGTIDGGRNVATQNALKPQCTMPVVCSP